MGASRYRQDATSVPMWYALYMRTTPDSFMASLGFSQTYRVGGSVRDELLGRSSKDSDYVIRSATLKEVAQALTNAGGKISKLKLRTGQQIGWRVDAPTVGRPLEIALPRREASTGPSRHDFMIDVDPTITLNEDAQRRDFTINALYYKLDTQTVIDPLDRGLKDLEARRLNCVHSASFAEDPLRILRALRFISKLDGFRLGLPTVRAMETFAPAVTGLTQKGVSGTALQELEGILMGRHPGAALQIAQETGVLAVFLPELAEMLDFEQQSPYHTKTTSEHTWDTLEAAAAMHNHAPIRVRMALLFHDCGKPVTAWLDENGVQRYYGKPGLPSEEPSSKPHEYWSAVKAGEALARLNAPKKLRKDVITLVERHMLPLSQNIRPFKVRRWRVELGDDLLRDLITHRVCDVLGKGGDTVDEMEVLKWIAAEQQRAINQKVPASVADLPISGKAIKSFGAKGPRIGEIQRQILDEIVAQPKLNTHEWAKSRAKKLAETDA